MRFLLFAGKLGYQLRAFDEGARRLGIEVQLVTDRCHVLDDPWGDRALAARYEDPAGSLATIDGAANGVLAVGDRPLYLAALAAQKLGVRFHSPESVLASQNKHRAREAFCEAGILVPRFQRFDLRNPPEAVDFPCVLKPLALSGSRGVIRANDADEFRAAWDRLARLLESPDILERRDEADRFVQVETYIDGREFAVEGVLANGQLEVLAIFDKPVPLEGPFFEETIYVTPSRESSETQARIVEGIEQAVAAVGLTDGPLHGECRVNDDGVWVLEVAGRPIGGLCSRALSFNGGMTLEELLLRRALGETMTAQLDGPASGVMMIPVPGTGVLERVDGVEQAGEIADVMITAKIGERLVPLPEGNSYPGFIFARAPTPQDVEQALKEAHSRLRFRLLKALH